MGTKINCLKDRILLCIAEMFNRNPEYCWSELVNWAVGYNPFWSLFFPWLYHYDDEYKSQGCRESSESTPYAYCGKCEQNGRFYNK